MESKNIEDIQRQLDHANAIAERLRADLEVAKKAGRKKALADIVEAIDKAGLTIEEVAAVFSGRKSRTALQKKMRATPDDSVKSKLPAKYKDPANEVNTWAGRGNSPKWLKDYEKAGQKKEEFLVSKG